MDSKVPFWWLIVTAAGALIFGTGIVWEIQRSRTEVAKLDIEKQGYHLRLGKNARLHNEIIKFLQDSSFRETHEGMWCLVDDFNTAEKSLAVMEGRKPTRFEFYPPNPPQNSEVK